MDVIINISQNLVAYDKAHSPRTQRYQINFEYS